MPSATCVSIRRFLCPNPERLDVAVFLQLLVLQNLNLHFLFLQLHSSTHSPNSLCLVVTTLTRRISGNRQATMHNFRCNLWGAIQLLTVVPKPRVVAAHSFCLFRRIASRKRRITLI